VSYHSVPLNYRLNALYAEHIVTTVLKQHSLSETPIETLIAADASVLSNQLQALRERIFPPASQKQLRRFTSGEAARLIGVSDSYLRQI